MKNYQQTFTRAALTAASALLLTAPAYAADFTDSAAIVNKEAVAVLTELGVISGKPDGSFDPGGIVRRNEMAKMISVLLDPDGGDYPSSGFTDVAGTWAEPYVDHCYSLGLVSGRGNGAFGPESAVSGTETAKMILTAAGYDTAEFTGSGWAVSVNAAAREAGLYEGLTGSPADFLTRDSAALLLYNGLSLLMDTLEEIGGMPVGIAVMPDGSLLLTDIYNRVVCQLKDDELAVYAGAVTEAADVNGRPLGGCIDGAAEKSTFRLPWAIAPFMGGWAVSDAENNVIRLILDGQVQTLNPAFTGTGRRTLSYPTGLAAGPDGSLYISDTHNGLIRRITPDGKMTTAARGLEDPMGLCWYNGSLYIAETGANRIVRLWNGRIYEVVGSGEEGYADGAGRQARFSGPQALAAGEDGVIYVSDTGNSAVRKIQSGRVTTLAVRDPADKEAVFPVSPAGLAVQGGKLYVCDGFTGTLAVLAVG